MRKLLKNLSVTVVALIVVVVLVDLIAFYVLDIKPGGYKAERFFEFSPDYGHVHKANAAGKYYRFLMGEKFDVTVNSHGFADKERSHDKTRPRIALIGDSTTEFWEVDEPERGQFVLEDRLGGSHEVINLSTRAYGTDQTYLSFKGVGSVYDPDIVVYTFCVNDPRDNTTKQGKPWFELLPEHGDSLVLHNVPVETPKNWKKYGTLYERSFIYRLYSEARNKLMLGQRVRRMMGSDARPAPHFELRCFKREYDARDDARMDLTLALISRLNGYVTSRGMKFLVVEALYKPMADQRMHAGVVNAFGDLFDADRLSIVLGNHCKREGIAFLSLPRVAKARGIEAGSLMHPRDNLHFNAEGIRFYADAVAQQLDDLGWLAE